MKLKDLIQAPPAEGWVKNSSRLVTGLFILAGLLYYPTQGYGTLATLVAALLVLLGQKILISQTNKAFQEMQQAESQFKQSGNRDYLRFIAMRASQLQEENKVLSDKGKAELTRLLALSKAHLSQTDN
ncbi:hypothetical protein [uncultured Haemophilus sp.]|uniref:hypothetical protein n=1 Tax=uncultured Haemophilus sp. TaxID=237779 RepID=UPI0028047174|nr:hypothetical protein [uncultured Haemophilus sp.]